MSQTSTLRKIQAGILAAFVAAILALGMGMGAQKAYANDAQDGLPVGASATVKIGNVTYTFKNAQAGSGVTLTAAKTSAKSIKVPATPTINGKKYTVKVVAAKAFKNAKKATTVTLPKTITQIKASAFAKSKVSKVILKTTKLKKSKVKKSLKGSKVKTIKAPAKKKAAYKKIFTKKNAGKKVTVK